MQYAFTFFYREHWILPYFAALNSFIDEVDAETGSSITSVNFMIDKLLATEKSLILRALADGHPLSELRHSSVTAAGAALTSGSLVLRSAEAGGVVNSKYHAQAQQGM